MKLAVDAELVTSGVTVFDYGCGRGGDLSILAGMGIRAAGWDPVHRPDATKAPADVVNLGYVVNVIEDTNERAATLKAAWELAEKVLIVSARSRP
ncbi:MAG: hypothetical protein ACM359_01510 [Bacillota bacterium]